MSSHDHHLIEDWILNAERAIISMTNAKAIDFLLYHLDGAAKEEVKLTPLGACQKRGRFQDSLQLLW